MNLSLLRFSLLISFVTIVSGVTAQNKFSVAINYIKNNKDRYLLKTKDVEDIRLVNQYTEAKTAFTHVNLNQYFKGISIYNAIADVHIGKDNVVAYATSSLKSDLEQKVINITPGISASNAVAKTLSHLNISYTGNLAESSKLLHSAKPNEYWFDKGDIALQDVSVELMLLPSDDDAQMQLVWKVNIYKKDARDWWDVFVNAQTGTIISKNNYVVSCSFAPRAESDDFSDGKIHPSPSPYRVEAANDFNVIQRPNEALSFGGRSIINSPWTLAGPDASPFGWLNDGTKSYTYLKGNNVFAYVDSNNVNATAAIASNSADGGAGLDFNFPIDVTQQPKTYLKAALTNLFYATNTMHDIWYHYGFTEPAGNFQNNNDNNGGLQRDYLNAEAQDSRTLKPCVRDNANMSTPADGTSPRMQMYIWEGTANAKINSPATIAGNYTATGASTFGPCLTNTNVTANVVIAIPNEGCSGFTNAAAMAGKIALIDRGTCAFTVKVTNAQLAGAVGVIVVNNVPGDPIPMGGTDTTNIINIPSIMISQDNGNILKTALATGVVNATINTISPELDGDLDNGIVFHEYGHGITHRLTSNGSTCMSNNERGDEGWSDWYALVLTQKPGDNAFTSRPIGTYVVHDLTTGPGIRLYPYNYNMAVDPHTYADIKNISNEVHDIGEIWCSALWDMYWLMINKYGYDPDIYNGTGGNNKAMQLVINGLKLQKCNPGFLDSRNAILKADSMYNGAANSCLIWSAFARRGMGFSAKEGLATIAGDETAASDLPPTCVNVVLAATLISLKAEPVNDLININWKTASEYNSAGFELQRKSSLNEPFITVGYVSSRSINSVGADYSFDDRSVLPNVVYYYRLIQKDKDGKQNYSQVVTAILKRQILHNVVVYPNPVDKIVYLQFGGNFSKIVQVKITDVEGRVLSSKPFSDVSNTRQILDFSTYSRGVYQISVVDENSKTVLKVIKK